MSVGARILSHLRSNAVAYAALATWRGLTQGGGAEKRNGRVGDPTRPFVVNGCSGRIEPGQCFTAGPDGVGGEVGR